jgi:acyl-CoA reductase-like NAD-dependent aldehyde dehydrogenase
VIAAEQFKRIGLELGGKSAGIVLPDADFGESMAAIVNGTTINSGQTCSLLSRVLVPRTRRDEFVGAFSAALDQLVVGDALDPATTLGPIVSQRQYERVLGYIELGVKEGARIVRGGGRPSGPAVATSSSPPCSSRLTTRCASRARKSSARSSASSTTTAWTRP